MIHGGAISELQFLELAGEQVPVRCVPVRAATEGCTYARTSVQGHMFPQPF